MFKSEQPLASTFSDGLMQRMTPLKTTTIPGRVVQGINVHGETSPMRLLFFGGENIARVQAIFEQHGFGRPAKLNLKPFMDHVFSYYASSFIAAIQKLFIDRDVQQISNMLESMDQYVFKFAENSLQANRNAMNQYQRDLRFRSFPDRPTNANYKNRSHESLINPYLDMTET